MFRQVLVDKFCVLVSTQSAKLPAAVSVPHLLNSMLAIANIEFSKWGTVLGDDKLAAAMIDRIVHHRGLIELGGSSHRMDAALMLGKANV